MLMTMTVAASGGPGGPGGSGSDAMASDGRIVLWRSRICPVLSIILNCICLDF